MICNIDPDFVDTMPAEPDPVKRDRAIEAKHYGEPQTPEGGGIGFVVSLWLMFALGMLAGSFVAASRCAP